MCDCEETASNRAIIAGVTAGVILLLVILAGMVYAIRRRELSSTSKGYETPMIHYPSVTMLKDADTV